LDLQDIPEPCRPQHHGEPRLNPVTAQVEPFYPWHQRMWRYVQSAVAMVFFSILIIFTLLCLMYMRHRLNHSSWWSIAAFQFLIAMCVELGNYILTHASRYLTERENHRTQSEHETQMLMKVMLLKFLNSYFVLFYIAFFKSHLPLFGQPLQCMNNDCFLDLQWQLGIFVFVRLTISSLAEYLWPKFRHWWRSCVYDQQHCLNYCHGAPMMELAHMSSAEQQARKEPYDSFSICDDHLITHGYATLFAVTSPWVCAATFLGMVVEIFVDVKSLCESRQRPIPTQAKTNDPWTMAFDVYGVLAASANIILLIFTSHQYESWTLTEKLCFFIYLEHMIFLSRMLLKVLLPELPRNVELLQLKQEQQVHRCLENIKVQQDMDSSMLGGHRNENIEVF